MATDNSQDVPMSASPLTEREAMELEVHLSDLARFLGAPGDWGYASKLGQFTKSTHQMLAELRINMEQQQGMGGNHGD